MGLRIVIPGGSGQVGVIAARHFHSAGHQVTVIARSNNQHPWRTVPWDGVTLGEWVHELDGADVVLNLAGRSVNCRYNPTNRREIMESRTRTTELVGEAIARSSAPPRLWMNASTATIYRHALDRPMDEATGELGGGEPGVPDTWNFSIDVAKSWEHVFFAAKTPNTRRVALRSAIVLSPDRGGIFDVLLGLVRVGLGGAAGSGKQFVSWVHHADFVHALDFIISHKELDGPVNIASPNPLPNREFMRAMRRAWGTPIGLPATEWMLEIGAVFLRTETELMLKSRQVISGKLHNAGFQFSQPDWGSAARELVGRWRLQGQETVG